MTPTARTRPPVATPSRRPSGVVRATLYDPNVKHGTDACAERTSIGTTVRAIGFGVANFNGRNAEVARIGERVAVGDGPHASDALICAATHAGTTRRIKPEIDTGPSALSIASSNPTSRWGFKRLLRASPFKSRSYAGHRCMNTGHERDSHVVTPARRALGFRPTDAGGSFFAMRELMAGAQ